MRIIFMGTPEFAVASLEALFHTDHQIVGVITAPDRPAGRGLKTKESAVKKFALEKNLPLLQPTNLKDPDFLKNLKALNADIQVVVAFRMLPESVWNMPPKGTLNLHASLLPQYRGAAPINRVLMNGETKTGVTTFKLQQEIDTGMILDQKEVEISEDMTAGDLHDRLMSVGARLLVDSINKIADGSAEYISQAKITSKAPLKKAPKIYKEDCQIDWSQSIDEIHNHIRGLSPYPGAWTTLNGKQLKVFLSDKTLANYDLPTKSIRTDHQSYLKIAVNGGFIGLKQIQLAGKKKMDIAEFLRGFKQDLIIN